MVIVIQYGKTRSKLAHRKWKWYTKEKNGEVNNSDFKNGEEKKW